MKRRREWKRTKGMAKDLINFLMVVACVALFCVFVAKFPIAAFLVFFAVLFLWALSPLIRAIYDDWNDVTDDKSD